LLEREEETLLCEVLEEAVEAEEAVAEAVEEEELVLASAGVRW
jgi:hypothetical protein